MILFNQVLPPDLRVACIVPAEKHVALATREDRSPETVAGKILEQARAAMTTRVEARAYEQI
jgi:hypothetical protein